MRKIDGKKEEEEGLIEVCPYGQRGTAIIRACRGLSTF